MVDTPPLIVPIKVHAMVLNGCQRAFQRWEMNYDKLKYWQSPEPQPFEGVDDAFATSDEYTGIYLLWTLPAALRHGTSIGEPPHIEFPLVPNRWLIVRYSGPPAGRSATAWVVESDQVNDASQPSPHERGSVYLDPHESEPKPIRLGRNRPLSGWQEPEPGGTQFLRAVAPGNLMFSAYQPACQNIFSFQDDLTTQNILEGTFSYLVVGWYADANSDPLAGWSAGSKGQDFADRLNDLRWSVTDTSQTTRRTLYHGMVTNVRWEKGTEAIPSARDFAVDKVNVAVGHTSIDALTALLTHQIQAQGRPGLEAYLLEAFQYGMLHILDQPNGKDLLEERIRAAWFGYRAGGLQWEIVAATPSGTSTPAPPPPGAEELRTENTWLAALNEAQAELDRWYADLETLQRDLYEMWWKRGYATYYANRLSNTSRSWPAGTSQAQFDAAFNTSDPASLVSQIHTLLSKIGDKLTSMPHESAKQSLQEAAEAYANQQKLPPSRSLKANARERFWHAGDPVVLISGVNHGQVIESDTALKCRTKDEIITEIVYDDTTITQDQLRPLVPRLDGLGNLPFAQVIEALVEEFFLLDPVNAASIAPALLHASDGETIAKLQEHMGQNTRTRAGKVLPLFGLTAWSQPWLPLYIDWEVQWYPIPYMLNASPLWAFRGVDFDWTQTITQPEQKVLQGRSLLTPNTNYSFKRRLEKFIGDHPDEDLYKALDTFIEQVDAWDFLSQTLEGFNAQVALRDPLASLAPDGQQVLFTNPQQTLSDLLGIGHHSVPQSLMLELPRFTSEPPPSTFEGLRSGQFLFNRITLVDQFGQTLEVITSQTSTSFDRLVIADGLKPAQYVLPTQQNRLVQLAPRLLQDARLNFSYVSSQDPPRPIQPGSDSNPIAGWVLPNHLDKALSIYDANGMSLGEMYVGVDTSGNKQVRWEPAPGGQFKDLPALAQDYAHLGQFLQALAAQDVATFDNLLAVIDETLWTVDPLGDRTDQNLSVLVGRPLALVRSSLQFELLQAPIRDPRWPDTFNTDPKNPLFVSNKYPFFVRLGNQLNRLDGLIGYFLDGNYAQFHAVHAPTAEQSTYIQKIAEGNYIQLQFEPSSVRLVTMLVDPRASVHAYTGLFPTYQLDLPQHFVDNALDKMEITFHVGPLLAHLRTTLKEQVATTNLLMPTPTEKNGVWSWWQLQSGAWGEMGIVETDQTAGLPDQLPDLREGLLKLKGALHDAAKPSNE